MSQIEELQGRIAAALDRIGQGLDQIGSGGGVDPSEVEALRQELEDERIAGEQLKERTRQLRARRQRLEAELEAARTAAGEGLRKFDTDLQGLREANEKLREINAKLREANEAGVADPELVNEAMKAELEGLRASRAADRAETQLIYGELSSAVESVKLANEAKQQPEGS